MECSQLSKQGKFGDQIILIHCFKNYLKIRSLIKLLTCNIGNEGLAVVLTPIATRC